VSEVRLMLQIDSFERLLTCKQRIVVSGLDLTRP